MPDCSARGAAGGADAHAHMHAAPSKGSIRICRLQVVVPLRTTTPSDVQQQAAP